jgi:HKD family nuclease
MIGRERGLYELLVTDAVEADLRELAGRLRALREPLRVAEVADRIALHLGAIVRRVVAAMPESDRTAASIDLARALVRQIDELQGGGVVAETPVDPGSVLSAIAALRPDGRPETIRRPLIPLLDTALLTNAPGEPRVGSQLLTEIDSADRIDVVMAFIRRSGIRPLLDALRRHCDHGRPLRVLTTTYTGSTELMALEDLRAAGAEVRVSYDTSTTRLHAKAWLFHRRSGFSTTYIGSSNLTHSAQVSGLEWNLRISGARNPDVVEKFGAVFES